MVTDSSSPGSVETPAKIRDSYITMRTVNVIGIVAGAFLGLMGLLYGYVQVMREELQDPDKAVAFAKFAVDQYKERQSESDSN